MSRRAYAAGVTTGPPEMLIGQTVRLPDGHTGEIVRVSPQGDLTVRLPDGRTVASRLGTVTFLDAPFRPASA